MKNDMLLTMESFVESLEETYAKIDDIEDSSFLVNLEGKVALEKLQSILNRSRNHNALFSRENLAEFYDFLEMRKHGLLNTGAECYLHPYLKINQICTVIAQLLTDSTNNYLSLLLPVSYTDNDLPHQLKLDQITIINDQLVNVFDVLCKFDQYAQAYYHSDNSVCSLKIANTFVDKIWNRDERRTFDLTVPDLQSIGSHSQESSNFYVSILQGSGSSSAKEAFIKAIDSNQCHINFKISAPGKIKLVAHILNLAEIENLSDIIYFMLSLEEKNWSHFIRAIENDKLFQLILGVDIKTSELISWNDNTMYIDYLQLGKLEKLLLDLNNANSMIESEVDDFKIYNQLRFATQLILVELYQRMRNFGPDYKSYVGYFFGYSKESKLCAAKILMDFMFEEQDDLASYCDRKGTRVHYGALCESGSVLASLATSILEVKKNLQELNSSQMQVNACLNINK